MKQHQADFSLNRKQRSLLVYVICVQYTKFWPEFGSSYRDKLSIHLVMEGVHLTVSLGMLKTMPCLNELMHVENWESDHLQHDLYVDISYEFTLTCVFVSHACTQITLMNTCMSDLVPVYSDSVVMKALIFNVIISHDHFHNSHEMHP